MEIKSSHQGFEYQLLPIYIASIVLDFSTNKHDKPCDIDPNITNIPDNANTSHPVLLILIPYIIC